mgnify:FL=1
MLGPHRIQDASNHKLKLPPRYVIQAIHGMVATVLEVKRNRQRRFAPVGIPGMARYVLGPIPMQLHAIAPQAIAGTAAPALAMNLNRQRQFAPAGIPGMARYVLGQKPTQLHAIVPQAIVGMAVHVLAVKRNRRREIAPADIRGMVQHVPRHKVLRQPLLGHVLLEEYHQVQLVH